MNLANSFLENETIRRLRARIYVFVKFVRICSELCGQPREIATKIAAKDWPLGMRPMAFFAIGASVILVTSLLDPHVRFVKSVQWFDILGDFNAEQGDAFLAIFGESWLHGPR
jgi:hypothetical protein